MRTLLLLLLSACSTPAPEGPDEPAAAEASCDVLTRAALDESLALGTENLVTNQKPAGNFHYLYDWKEKTQSLDDNAVRQAGATWGLALMLHDKPDPKVRAALLRALAFWELHMKESADGRRWPVYPGMEKGSQGTVALLALAYVELLRAEGEPDEERDVYRRRLDGLLRQLAGAQRSDGLFSGYYVHNDGTPYGRPSPYGDGETLLALVKAVRYLGAEEYRPLVLAAADAGYLIHNQRARQADPDSDETKGYYQWSSMAYFELATSGWEGTEVWGERLVELADWMVDVHETLRRTRNTAYAYEGIIPAWEVARQRGDTAHVDKLGCVIHQGLGKLTTWQVGHSMANDYVAKAPEDPASRGGIQNHRKESGLRVDVVQHQMHAVILARRYFLTE